MEMKSINPDQLSAAMRQYYDFKIEHEDCIIFYQLGDFYELFFEDAIEVSNLLNLTLTGKKAGLEDRIPMAGIPVKALDDYLKQLMSYDKKVGIVSQDDEITPGSKLVTRTLKKIITPGTYHDDSTRDNVYIGSFIWDEAILLAYADVATGEAFNFEPISKEGGINEVIRLGIKELVINKPLSEEEEALLSYYGVTLRIHQPTTNFQYQPKQAKDMEIVNVLLLDYLASNHIKYSHIENFELINNNDYMKLTLTTAQQLELVSTLKSGEYTGSLFWYLNHTKTAMGRRLLKKWILRPLVNISEITKRQHFTELFKNDVILSSEVEHILSTIYDFERIIGRINDNVISPREMYQLVKSIRNLVDLKQILLNVNDDLINDFASEIDPLSDIYDQLDSAICENTLTSAASGGILKDGYDEEVDRLRKIRDNSTKWLTDFESREREQTGIKNLKVSYNKVFGYFIEISNGNIGLVPEHYIRKQTMVNAERYITDELKEAENEILNAAEMVAKLEQEIYKQLKQVLIDKVGRIKILAQQISTLDVYVSLGKVANVNRLVKPSFVTENKIEIINGRHPIVEQMCDNYIVNDCVMDEDNNTLLITGPNMAGKSTYMRQIALTVIMGQIGGFVAADQASLKIFEQVFTRIGASDDLSSGQSTFMVEMNETSYALRYGNDNSLFIFDELGRGTSTYDGIALAQSIIEYLESTTDGKILFSTHYHELTNIANSIPSVRNVHVKAEEEADNGLTFFHKVIDGAVQKSYGIEVAALAHLPQAVIIRSKQLINILEQDHNIPGTETVDQQLIKENAKNVQKLDKIKLLLDVDVNTLTPIEASIYLANLQKELKDEI